MTPKALSFRILDCMAFINLASALGWIFGNVVVVAYGLIMFSVLSTIALYVYRSWAAKQ